MIASSLMVSYLALAIRNFEMHSRTFSCCMACDPCIILFYLGYGMIGGWPNGTNKDYFAYRLYNG
jgi:hypothetical protein